MLFDAEGVGRTYSRRFDTMSYTGFLPSKISAFTDTECEKTVTRKF